MKLFQSFRLDAVNHCLWHAEERVSLSPKAFDVLRYLVEHPGRLVTQNEMLEALWPERYVNPELIKKYILGIRKVLGDNPSKPVFIETFPRRGYQFVAPVSDERPGGAADVPSYSTKKMVGRDPALAELASYLNMALRGRRQLIFVTGEAGIGKTMLVDAFHHQAAWQRNVRMARGQCVEGFGGKEAYYPMLEALGQLIRDTDTSPVAEALAKRAPTWWIQFPSLVKSEKREALQREILGATRERMVREICETLEVITAENPLVLILEDLHWVDPSTLDLISALARRREPAKLMLLGTYRPTDVALSQTPLKGLKQDLQVHHLCGEIALERLEEPTIAEYLATEFPKASSLSGLSSLVYRHSGGNPLFMAAIVLDMVKKGLIAHAAGAWILTKPLKDIDPGVPETLQQMLEAQFSQLSVEEQRILSSGSVVGERFSVWAIRPTLEIETDHVEDLLEGLSEKQQFVRSAGIQELPDGSVSAHYEFRHSLFRQVLYRRLSSVTRSKLHRRIGEQLRLFYTKDRPEIASELALHFEEGHEYEQAIRYLLLNAENAQRRFAHGDAIRVLHHALELVQKIASNIRVEVEIQILKCIGDAHYALGQVIEAAQAYQAEVDRAAQAGLTKEQVSALTRLAYASSPTDSPRGIATSERAVDLSKSLGDPILLARTQVLAAAFRLLHDRWRKEDADICTATMPIIEQLSAKDVQVAHEILYLAQAQILQGEYGFALNAENKLRDVAGSSALIGYLGAWGKSLALAHTGRFGELLITLGTLIDIAAKNGNKLWFCAFSGWEAWLRIITFDFHGARKLCDTVLPMCAGNPGRTPRALILLSAGRAELGLGNHQEAVRCFSEVESMTTERFYMYWWWRMQAHLGLARTWLALGNITNARTGANCFLECALSTSDPNIQVLAWEMKTRLAIAEEDWTGAGQSIRAALAILDEHEVPVSAWRAHAAAWELYRLQKNYESAEFHRAHAEAGILALADSFPHAEPLRGIFLAADPVRRIMDHVPASRNVTSDNRKKTG
jgi:DNA-binding winged helix-turn-helix (wHTH) protein/tetratricopeptide (TPR) repeat protein